MATRKRAAHPRKDPRKSPVKGSVPPPQKAKPVERSTAPAATGPAAPVGTPKTGTTKTGTKSAFILGFSHDTPSRAIVEAGAAKGLTFTQSYVATIRALERKRTGMKATRSVGRPRSNGAAKLDGHSRIDGRDGLEARFARLALDLGLSRAGEVLRLLQSEIDRLTR